MDSSTKNSPAAKNPLSKQSKIFDPPKDENQNPNFINPSFKLSKSPSIKSSTKPQKSALKNTNPDLAFSPKNRIRDRKFVIAKRNSKREKPDSSKTPCNCNERVGNKCLCVAYESLRASQEEFFKPQFESENDVLKKNEDDPREGLGFREMGCLIDEMGSGKVMSLVKAFERLKTETGELKDEKELEGSDKEGEKLDFLLGSRSLVSSSLDGSQGSFTFSSKSSCAARRSRRNSTELSGIFGVKRWRKKKQLRATRQQPFKLLTEQRGKNKEEEFSKKLQEMAVEEQKQRIPIAQGLPWTTDEPENLVKPPVKEITVPVDLVLYSDVRAMDRAEFDQKLAEKEALIEQWRMERERQQKITEEEEIIRLRKELIPKAQPMPYFDRPFIPRRSEKDPTIPREPKVHIPHHKKLKSCLS